MHNLGLLSFASMDDEDYDNYMYQRRLLKVVGPVLPSAFMLLSSGSFSSRLSALRKLSCAV